MLLGHRTSNTGHDLENMVFLELLRREYQIPGAETPRGEIDFYTQRGEETRYIQVTLNAPEPDTLIRRLRPFETLSTGSNYASITMDRLLLDTEAIPQLNAAELLAGVELSF